jgi:hypothetical protein
VKSHTVTTVLAAPSDRVFAYLSDIENLPDWATEFARELKVVDGRHKVVNRRGEFFFEIRADKETGVIAMLAGPEEDQLALYPTRVVPLEEDRSAFTFTMFQWPGLPDELFESSYASLQREFKTSSASSPPGRSGGRQLGVAADEQRVPPAACEQLFVPADLDHTAVVEHDDLIRVAHRREPVRDRDRRPAF